jgi:hypothetical protein
MKRLFLALALSTAPVLFVGCGNPSVQTPAPPKQSVDLTIARTLSDAQASIEQAKTLVPAHPALKDPLNDIIDKYNLAYRSYLVFHQAVTLGQSPDPVTLLANVQSLAANAAALVVTFKGPIQ